MRDLASEKEDDNVEYCLSGSEYISVFKLPNIIHLQEDFNEAFCDHHFNSPYDVESWKSEKGFKKELIIGMHPDQATEPIVDMALKYLKPFAVVPCCVFAHENPHRRLKYPAG